MRCRVEDGEEEDEAPPSPWFPGRPCWGRLGGLAAEEGFAGAAGDGGEAHEHEEVAVEGDAEVGVESEEGVCNPWEETLEAGGVFGAEVAEGSVGNDAVGVVGEDVVLCGV